MNLLTMGHEISKFKIDLVHNEERLCEVRFNKGFFASFAKPLRSLRLKKEIL